MEEVLNQLPLSKKERRRLRREEEKTIKERDQARKKLTKALAILGAGAVLVIIFFAVRYINAKRYGSTSRIEITPSTYSFGNISAEAGVASTDFTVKNAGVSVLTISGARTSCGCTTATLEFNGEVSPVFGMHSGYRDWSLDLEPGQAAKLIVMFDPNFHQNTSGPITRYISVFSNDPKPEAKVTIQATVQR